MIRFPYGVSDFFHIRDSGMLYLDRTAALPALEAAGAQLLFLRPRRFGKSLLLSVLANYYDANRAGDFSKLFGDLAIGANPTLEHNRYLVLRWDFSKVSAQGDTATITRNLFGHMNEAMAGFADYYQAQLRSALRIHEDNALASFESLVNVVKNSGYPLYLLIDEYDNFANEVLMQAQQTRQRYEDLVQSEGILKTVFKAIKASASEGKLRRVFITGVSPVVMSDMTSGYNVVTSIYLEPELSAVCGITAPELTELVQQVAAACPPQQVTAMTVLATMREFYNGYRFCSDMQQPKVYNPTLCFYFLRNLQKHCVPPEQILDANLAMDAGKIRYIAALPRGEAVIRKLMDEQTPMLIDALENRFGIEALQELQGEERFMVSLLYYFGVLTLTGRGILGELELGIPNLVTKALYVEALRKRVLPEAQDTDTVRALARQVYQTADLTALAEFMERKYLAALSNRDYRWSNELTVKTAFLTLLFNDTFYVMDSESALQRHYSDLTLIVRSNMRQYALLDIVFEFKYLPLTELGLSGEQVCSLSRVACLALPAVQTALTAALAQLAHAQQVLIEKYQQPQRLRCLAVVALGFDKLVWQRLDA